MSLPILALVGLAALAGPLLAGVARWRMPVVIGQLLAGILIGGSGLRLVNAADPMFTFLGEVGFAVTMFVAGTHVPVNDARLRPALGDGLVHREELAGPVAEHADAFVDRVPDEHLHLAQAFVDEFKPLAEQFGQHRR